MIRLRHFALVFLYAVVSAGCASAGVSRAEEEAVEKEIRVGRSLSARLAKKYGVIRNAELTKYVNMVARNVSENSSRPELNFRVGILDAEIVNAFSCPGGYILITKGALKNMQSESELSFVLAHEISHTALEHSGRYRESSGFVDFVTGFISGGGNVVNGFIRTTTEKLEKELLESGRERKLELEADNAGAVLLAASGYDVWAGVNYLKRLSDVAGTDLMTKTHPAASARADQLSAFLIDQGYLRAKARRNEARFQNYRKMLE